MDFSEFIDSIQISDTYYHGFVRPQLFLSQVDILRSLDNPNTLNVIKKSRQDGISTVMVIYLAWLLTKSPIKIAIASHRNSREIFRQFINMNLSTMPKTEIHNVN